MSDHSIETKTAKSQVAENYKQIQTIFHAAGTPLLIYTGEKCPYFHQCESLVIFVAGDLIGCLLPRGIEMQGYFLCNIHGIVRKPITIN